MEITRDYAVTLFGITALQMPTLISIAPKDSLLFNLQSLGCPFNLDKQFMRDHVAFSPVNLFAGRFYTLFTSVYYHTDHGHLLRNFSVLSVAGNLVHKRVGRLHFLSIFHGGAIFGNFGMWLHCLGQQYFLNPNVLKDLLELPSSTNNILVKICPDSEAVSVTTTSIPESLGSINIGITCYGSSAGVHAILSFGACCSAERIVKRLQECIAERCLELDIYFFSHLFNVLFTVRMFSSDVSGVIASFLTEIGFLAQVTNSGHVIGYAGHVAGSIFGVAYYYFKYIYKR